jgi:hypothetical protein
MFLQLHRVLNYVRASFQRSWLESCLFGYWSCEAASETAHEAKPLTGQKYALMGDKVY